MLHLATAMAITFALTGASLAAGKPETVGAGKPGTVDAGQPGTADAGKPGTADVGKPGTADVAIIIDGVDPGKGIVNVAFCDTGPLESCGEFGDKQPASAETLGFRFEGIPPGRYAFVGYQDLDSSGEMERNFLGMPKEPFALGNRSDGSDGTEVQLFPPPDFDDVATPIVEGPNVVRLTLRTMSGTTKKRNAPTLPPEAVPLKLVEAPKP